MLINNNDNRKIYRILSQEHFFQICKEKKNTLVLPREWVKNRRKWLQDPFENFILRSTLKSISTGEKGKFDSHDIAYAQCWTLNAASAAMWQIYSNGANAVKIKTTVDKLSNGLYNANPKWEGCYIGEVDYLTKSKLHELSQTIFKHGVTSEAIACSLLVKRRPYKYEKEVRLIYIIDSEKEKKKHVHSIYTYDIDPYDMIEEVVLSPHATDDEYARFKERVTKCTSLADRQVKHSSLYHEPKGFTVIIP